MSDVLSLSQIKMPGTARSKDDAIREAGEILVAAGAVEDQPDEPTADVARAEMDGDAAHPSLTAFRRL